MTVECSVVIPAYNAGAFLKRTLDSIFAQHPPFAYEVIVVDDGSQDTTRTVCEGFPVRYRYLDRPEPGNCSVPRNVGYQMAQGPIIVSQSHEIEHRSTDVLEKLVTRLTPSTFVLATVENVTADGQRINTYCGVHRQRPLMFLGAVWKADLYAIGGNDEDFAGPGAPEDVWLSQCLIHIGRTPTYWPDIVGWHYDHPHRRSRKMHRLVDWKIAEAKAGRHPWTARAGAWTPCSV